MNKILFALLTIVSIYSCGNDEPETENGEEVTFFPILSILQGQVKDVENSVYPVVKIVTTNNVSDTVYIRREEFKNYAKDFISIDDISSKKTKKKYTETKIFDELLQKAIFTYTAKDADAEIRRQEVIISPGAQSEDKIESIYIDKIENNKNNTTLKKLLWEMDKRFTITTISQTKNEPEKIEKLEVIWNDPTLKPM